MRRVLPLSAFSLSRVLDMLLGFYLVPLGSFSAPLSFMGTLPWSSWVREL